MKLLPAVLLLLFFTNTYSQDEKAALKYYEIGLKKLKDRSLLEKGQSPYGKAFPYFFKASELAREGSDLQLKAIYQISYLYNFAEEENKPEILKRLSHGVALIRKSNRNDTLAADLFFRGGFGYRLNYQSDSALYCFSEAKKIYVRLYLEESAEVSNCYQLMGDTYLEALNDYTAAERYYEKALAILEKKRNGETNAYTQRLYSQLSRVNRFQHDLDKALVYQLKAITYWESLYYPKKSPEYASWIEVAYSGLASIYREMNHFSEAKHYLIKAIQINKEAHTGSNTYLAYDYMGIAEIFQNEGKLEEAIINFKKACLVFQSSMIIKEIGYISCLEKLGDLYLQKRDYKSSKESFVKALKIIDEYGLKKSGQAAGLYKSIGDYYDHIQMHDSSLYYYQKGLISSSNQFQSSNIYDNPALELIDLKSYAYGLFVQKALVLQKKFEQTKDINNLLSALKCFRVAEALLVLNRSELDSDDSKRIFFETNFDLYEQVISLLYKNQEVLPKDSINRAVFYYMESSKSKTLADALNEAEYFDPLMFQDSLVQLLNLQKRNLYQLNNRLKNLKSNEEDKKKELRNTIVKTDRIIQLTEAKMNEKYAAYVNVKYKHHVAQLQSMESFCHINKVGLIEYFWGSKNVYALTIDSDGVAVKKIGDSDSLNAALQPVILFLNEKRNVYSKKEIQSFINDSHHLYKKLINDLGEDHSERLVIIPDGPLGQLPFEVLVSSPGGNDGINFYNASYLVKSNIISYSFSSAYLLRKRKENLNAPGMLAFGFTNGRQLRSSGNEEYKQPEIAGSETELIALREKFPDGKFFFGSGVTEAKFKYEAPNYDLIHLAVHGKGDTEEDYSASLFFRDEEKDSIEDGELHWYELFGIHLKAKLAVISSCESGIGKNYKGEGMLSMAGAFAFAGCENIVMGLWKVDDRVSVELMDQFYGNLKEGQPLDEALTKAKRNYLKNADDLTANPKRWASLVTYGNENVIRENYLVTKIVIAAIAFLLTFLLLFLFIKRKRLLQ